MFLPTYNALNRLAPSYLIVPYSSSWPLLSSGAGLLSIPKAKKKSAGNGVFSSLAPYQWKSLPPVIREADSAEIVQLKLKAHISSLYFGTRGCPPLLLQFAEIAVADRH